MRKLLLACLLVGLVGLSGCFSPQIDLSGLDGLVRIGQNDDGKKDKDKDKDTEKKSKKDE